MKTRFAILDFDGVVADTESVFAQFDCDLLNTALKNVGKSEQLTPQQVRKLAGMAGEHKLIHISKLYDFDIDAVKTGFLEARKQGRPDLFKQKKISLGKNLLSFLKENHSHIALATNKRQYKLEMDAAALNLESLFDIIVTCDEPLKPKPEPDILLKAAKQLGAEPQDCLYIGDNTNDMVAAKAAGMLPIGFIITGIENNKPQETALRDSGAQFVYDDFNNIQNHMANKWHRLGT